MDDLFIKWIKEQSKINEAIIESIDIVEKRLDALEAMNNE